MKHTNRNAIAFSAIFALFVASLSSCMTIRVISAYDEPTDKALTFLQKSTDDYLTKLIGRAPSKENVLDRGEEFYDDADRQLRQLEFRVQAIPKNAPTVKIVTKIRGAILGKRSCDPNGASLYDLQCLSRSNSPDMGPGKAALQIAQRNIDQTISAALALELAKKQALLSLHK